MIIDSVYLPVNYPSFVHPTIQDRKYAFVVVKIQMPNRIEGENLSEQAKDDFIKSEVQLILLSPGERAPILITTCSQDRYDHENWLPWDEILKSSNHAYFEITDDECEAILTAISTAPIG